MRHTLLRKQVNKYLSDELTQLPEVEAFLNSVNDSYQSFERDSELTEHAFNLSEREFAEVNAELTILAIQRKRTLDELNKTVGSLLGDQPSTNEPGDLLALSERIRQQVKVNKHTEEELSRNINLFKTLLGNMHSGVLIENEDGKILYTNDMFCKLFSLDVKPDDLIGLDGSRHIRTAVRLFKHPEKFAKRTEIAFSNKKPVYDEVLEMADGSILEKDYIPIFIDGVYRGHLCEFKDVTKRMRYQEELRENEERNRMVLDSSLDAIIIADEDRSIEYWNPRAEQLFGWTQEEARGRRMNELLHPGAITEKNSSDTLQYPNHDLSPILNRVLEVSAVNKAGEEFMVELIVVSYQQQGKTFYCKFIKDISDRKRSENRLREQEEKYRNILANMNLGLLEVDSDENIMFVNQSFCEMSGYPQEELLGGKTTRWLELDSDRAVLESKQQLRARGISDSYELYVRNREGELRCWLVSGAPNYNDQGELLGSVGIHLDITEQKKLEAELDIAKTRAEQASAAKEAFLANMSHEIRTPLNAIIGMIRELSREELSPKQQTYLSHTDSAARHLLSIVNSILDISKIEAGELELDEHDFSLEAVVANIQSILHIKAASKNIELVCKVDPAVSQAYVGDSMRIRQILINLLDNALKFTLDGSVKLYVEVIDEGVDTQSIRINITDTGIGMDKEYLDKLFMKFSQAEKSTSRRFGGTGLGMSITREILKMMGGTISVESEKGKGTHFTIDVDMRKGNVERLSEATLDNQHLLQGAHLLLVEDNVMNRFIATKSLSHFGCTVDEAENGRIALELLKEREYDLILMDIQMPELDGVETTKIIRNELKLELPIIAVTANAFKKDIDLYLSIGMNDYVTKPFEEKHLFKTLHDQLRQAGEPFVSKPEVIDDGYDLSQLQQLSRGDEEFVRNMVDIFVQHTPPAVMEINEALAAKDYPTLAKTAHRIKPSIESMGISQLDGLAKDIELHAKSEAVDPQLLAGKVTFLSETLYRVVDRIRSERA